jgi:hypothetical protein
MINLHIGAQEIQEYIKAGSHANIPTIVNAGDGKFEVHCKKFVKEDALAWRGGTGVD